MRQSIVIRSASELLRSDVAKYLCGIAGQAYRAPSQDGPYSGIGRAAVVDGEIVGLITGHPVADNDGSQRRLLSIYGAVRPDCRRRGVGGQLLDGIVEECRSLPAGATILASVDDGANLAIVPFLQRHGFERQSDFLNFEKALVDAPPPDDVTPLSVAVYRGGEPSTDGAIVELYRRAYRHRRAIPQLTTEQVREQLALPSCAYLLVSEAGRLVGHAMVHWSSAGYVVHSILIARSHWGSGAADLLGRALIRHALTEGCRRIVGIVEATNAASRELCERHGLSVTGRTHRFSLTL